MDELEDDVLYQSPPLKPITPEQYWADLNDRMPDEGC